MTIQKIVIALMDHICALQLYIYYEQAFNHLLLRQV